MTDHKSSDISRRKFLITTGAAVGGTAVMSGAAPFVRAASAPLQVPVGMVEPFSGSAAEFGPFYEEAAKLAIKHVNKAAEKVLGGPIITELKVSDSNTLPTPGIDAAKRLIEVDGVPAIICGWSSGVTVAVATSATLPAGVLQVGNGTTSPLVTVLPEDRDRDLLFRTTASDALQGVVAAQMATGEIVEDLKYKTASTVYINNPYGQGLSNAFSQAFQEMGGEVHAQVPHPEEVQSTYKSQLAIALKDDPDLLMVPSYPSHTSVILKESRDVFEFTTWQLTDGNKSEDVLSAVGADTLNRTYGTAPGVDDQSPAFKAFDENFEKDDRPPFTESAYDAAAVIGLALAKAIVKGDITDADEVTGSVIRDQLREIANPPGEETFGGDQSGITEAMERIASGEDMNYTGPSGPTDFDEHGDVVTPYDIWKVEDGEFKSVRLWPADKIKM